MDRRTSIVCLLTLALAGVLVFYPWPAMAQAIVGNTICPGPGLTERVVGCIRTTVLIATANFLLPFSAAINHVVKIMCTIAVAFYGINLLFNRGMKPQSEGAWLAVKLATVLFLTWNFGGMFPWVLASVDWLVESVSQYTNVSITLACQNGANIWQRIDCALDRLIGGMLPGTLMSFGFLGFLAGALFSGPIGVSIFLTGLGFVVVILMGIFKATYIYLSAYIAIAIMVCVSPIFIPMMLFKVTAGYFQKWIRLFTALVLQPIFLFAYLSMLLAAFDVMIFSSPRSLYVTIAGPQAMNPNFRLGLYMNQAGAYVNREQLDLTLTLNPNEVAAAIGMPGIQNTGMFGVLEQWAGEQVEQRLGQLNANAPTTWDAQAIDFQRLAQRQGKTLTVYIIEITMQILMAAVVAYVFYIMLEFVPYLGLAMTAEVMSLPNLGGGVDRMLGNIRSRLSPRPGGI